VAALVILLCAQALAAEMPQGKYLEAPGAKVAVILAHGQGLDADSQVVSPLRKGIHRELGFHTLSLQMPVLHVRPSRDLAVGTAYIATFPDAFVRIQAAIDFLRQGKGVERIYLMGYSMGGRMTTAFLAEHPEAGIVGSSAWGSWPEDPNRSTRTSTWGAFGYRCSTSTPRTTWTHSSPPGGEASWPGA